MSKRLDIYRQKLNINELNNNIAKCNNAINVLENKKKFYKKWAIIPSVLIGGIMFAGCLIFKASTGFADWATFQTIFEASGMVLTFPLFVSVVFPLLYGFNYYNASKSIQQIQKEKAHLEEYLSLNEERLESMEKVYNKDRSLDDDNSRWDVIRKFCDNEEAMLLELYEHGRLGECEKLGFSFEEIVFIQNLLEAKRMPDNSLPLDSTIKQGETLKRVNYKMR